MIPLAIVIYAISCLIGGYCFYRILDMLVLRYIPYRQTKLQLNMRKSRTEEKNKTASSIIRWILVVPGSLVISLGLGLLIALINTGIGLKLPVRQFINNGILFYFFVFFAAKIAPEYKTETALILSILALLLIIVLSVLATEEYMDLVYNISGAIGAVLGFVQVVRKYGFKYPVKESGARP